MAMHNPPHPGEFIRETYMNPFGLSCRYLAEQLDIAASTLNRVLKQQNGIQGAWAFAKLTSVKLPNQQWWQKKVFYL